MQKQQKLHFEEVFTKCNNLCKNCSNYTLKHTILPMKNGKQVFSENKNKTRNITQNAANAANFKCGVLSQLFACARKFEKEAATQFDRVEPFHVAVRALEQNCGGKIASSARDALEHEWMRVLLYTHDALPNLIKILEDIIDDRALAKTLGLGLNIFKESTYDQVEQMLKMLERKRNLNELYFAVEDMIACLSDKSKKMIEIRFLERKSAAEAAEMLGLNERTVQRRTERLLDEMTFLAPKYSLTADELLFRLGNKEPWMLNWFRL